MKKTITLDTTMLVSILLAVFFGFIVGVAQPFWGVREANTRTIEVEGTATVDAAPDENVFYPEYEAKDNDKKAARDKALKIGNKVVDDLLGLGIEQSKITSDVYAYEDWDCGRCNNPKGFVGYNSLTIKVVGEELSEDVYNLLLDTDAAGNVSPQSGFSDEMIDSLKVETRAAAVEKARAQAAQLAGELGDEVGEVISIEEVQGFDDYPIYFDDAISLRAESADSSASSRDEPLLTGEQELSVTVKAVFEIK